MMTAFRFTRPFLAGLVLLGGGLLAGCASEGSAPPSGNVFQNAPAWVVKGSGGFPSDKGRVLYGVGSSQGVQNLPLAIEDANLRARASLAAVFSTYIDRLEKDYARSLGAGEGLRQNDESQGIEVPLEGFTHMELKGSQIVNHWQDPKTGTIFALAEVDMAQFKKDLKGYRQMDESLKKSILEDMNHAFDALHKARKAHRTP